MQPAKRLSESSPSQAQPVDRGLSRAKDADKIASTETRPRPFVERRRRRSLGQSWEEALDCIHQHMRGFEAANEQLRESGDQYRAIFEDAPIGMFQITPQGRPLKFNRAMARIFGFESLDELLEDFPGKEAPVLIDPNQWSEWMSPTETSCVRYGIEVKIVCPNGEAKWVRLNVRAVLEGGEVAHFEGTGEDITERKRVEVRNQLLAYYDRVTGLPNRALFGEKLDEAMKAARRVNGEVALLLIRIDRFKVINDSLGALFGDRLLNEIAERIKASAGKRSTVARVGGAEFAVVLPEVGGALRAQAVGANIVGRLSDDFTWASASSRSTARMEKSC